LGWYSRGEFWKTKRGDGEVGVFCFERRIRKPRGTCGRKSQTLF
jgi:hypothetical protein